MEETTITEKEAMHLINPSLFLGEASCNSSECGASSTCETVNMSDGPEGRIFHIRGRRRKRKKNLTGWPAEKQRGKKKQVTKVNRIDENVPTNKCANIVASVKKDSEKADVDDRVEDVKKEVDSEQTSGLSRTESVEYQPCVRVTKMPDLSSSSSYYVAGISNNRRLRSSSLSSSPPTHSVPLPRKYPSLSADGLKRRASPRKCTGLQWNAWSTRRRR
ncbi:hypothetical protein L9F63_014845 [Diploptera punctata]|uniref:Uncharacterized protein n=1 Tax=Diploptera punctata TaxID=6984 RepID=A0AAD8EKJ6_DIPPU|nr:hypothetical protein L9F63_014845 [Diploptera punctata]